MVHVEHPYTFTEVLDKHFRTALYRNEQQSKLSSASKNYSYACFQSIGYDYERAPFYLRSLVEYLPFLLLCVFFFKKRRYQDSLFFFKKLGLLLCFVVLLKYKKSGR